MGTPLSTPSEDRNPSLKLRNVGDYADLAIVDIGTAPRYVFGTRDPRISTVTGKPQTQDVLTCLVVGGKGVISGGDNATDRAAEAGEVVTVFVAGRDRWDKDGDAVRAKGDPKSWSGAKNDHGALQVGDVLRWKFEAEVPGQGAQPRKVRTFKLRSPRPDEAAQTQRCEELHAAGKQRTELAPAAAGRPAYDDDAPF